MWAPSRIALLYFSSYLAAGGPISEQLADIDSETGPGGEGALGGESEVALVLLSTSVTAGAHACSECNTVWLCVGADLQW